MLPRPDLLDGDSPSTLEVYQLTNEPDVPSSHIYMEAQIFSPDSRRLVLHRSATPHGSDKDDPEHSYLLCDLENDGELAPITSELGATGPSISPDGGWLYYFVNETEIDGGRLSLRRVRLDGTERETVAVVDGPLPGTDRRPSRIYPLSTISSDGQRIAISCFLGKGTPETVDWGLMVFHIATGEVSLILRGPSWCNIHPQYCRSTDPEASHDILVQENHGNVTDASGAISRGISPPGADIHVIRDDGSNFRDMPWGRDGVEGCQGHQCWRGRSLWAITSTGKNVTTAEGGEDHIQELIEGLPAPHAGHVGLNTPGGVRHDLSHSFDGTPRFCHFATDAQAHRFITDYRGEASWSLYAARFADAGDESASGESALRDWRYLLDTRSGMKTNKSHIHPFLSPDGRLGFFNSDESGTLQAYMARGLDQLWSAAAR